MCRPSGNEWEWSIELSLLLFEDSPFLTLNGELRLMEQSSRAVKLHAYNRGAKAVRN